MVKKRKGNPGKGVDFKRVRSKVGRKLPQAQNQTDTTIRSKAINLPGQNLRDQKDADAAGKAVSSRNLNLRELLAQAGHYSEKVRRDAMAGLNELLSAHPREATKSPLELLEKLSARMADSDATVRRALTALLREAALPALQGCDASAFLPMMMAHLSSAMTHIAAPIRADALGILEVLMAWAPAEIVDGYLEPCLTQFDHLLSSSQRGQSVKTQSISSLHKVASSLHSFLRSAEAADVSRTAKEQPDVAAAANCRRALQATRCRWPPRSAINSSAAKGQGELDACASLAQRLLECWMECAPAHMATQPELTTVECMAELLGCANLVMGRLKASPSATVIELALGKKGKKKEVTIEEALLQIVAPHFPAVAVSEPPPPEPLKVALSWVNIRTAQLLQRLLPRPEDEEWVGRLVGYWSGICRHGHILHSTDWQLEGGRRQASESSGVAEEGSLAALNGFKETIFRLPQHHRRALVTAVGDMSERSPPRSAPKLACLALQRDLLARAAAVPGGLSGAGVEASGHEGSELIGEEEAARWLSPLPKMLWDLGAGSPEVSRAALDLLVMIGRLACPGSRLAGLLDELQIQMVPLYIIMRSKRSAGKGELSTQYATPGPLVELPEDCQRLAVDLVWYYPSMSEPTLRAVALMALMHGGRPGKQSPAYPVDLGVRAVEIIIERCHQGSGQPHEAAGVEPRAYLSFLLSILLGCAKNLRPLHMWPQLSGLEGAGDLHRRFWRAHIALVDLAGRALAAAPAPSPGGLLGFLAPALVRELAANERQVGARGWYGLVQVALRSAKGKTGIPENLLPMVPRAVVAYALDCITEDGELESPLIDGHPGLEPCLSLLAASPILMAPVLEALTLAATRSEVKGVRNMPSVEKAAQIVAGARLVSATCRRQELKEGALEVQEAIDGALQALVAAASRLGPAAAGNFKADRACRQVSMQVDTLFGRVS